MAITPPLPPNPVPAINKTYTDIKFFVKSAETTKAFAEIPFTGTVDGYLQDDGTTKIPYPNEDFDNENTGVYPYIDLPYLSDNFELKTPISLGNGGVEGGAGNIVTSLDPVFDTIEEKTYLLYRVDGGTFTSTADGLKVLGYVETKTDDNEVILSKDVPATLEGLELELFSWTGDNNDEDLYTLNFNFQDSFYMVVKNADYTATNHDAVLLIDVDRTSTNYTNSPQPFAYSANKIINPTYFSIERITKVYNPTTSEEDINIVSIPCSIKGVSKWSEKSMFETLASVPTNKIPFWSVYEVIPNANSGIHLDKNTFYRVTINDALPSSRVYAAAVPPE